MPSQEECGGEGELAPGSATGGSPGVQRALDATAPEVVDKEGESRRMSDVQKSSADIPFRKEGSVVNLLGWTLDKYVYRSKTILIPDGLKLYRELGAGSYGSVFAVLDANGDQHEAAAAIKMFNDPMQNMSWARQALRELRLLRLLAHENIVGLRTMYCGGSTETNFGDLYLAIEYMEGSLNQVLGKYSTLTSEHQRYFMYQILRGLAYIHGAGVIHRDVKPRNLLINAECDLRIADFGMSRFVSSSAYDMGQEMTEYVCTRWYRAPELLCFNPTYSGEVDVWSSGVVFLDMLTDATYLKGVSTTDQLERIVQLLGLPTEDQISRIPNVLARKWLRQHERMPEGALRKALPPTLDPEVFDFLTSMLKFDPSSRASARGVLAHPWLRGMYLEDHAKADETSAEHLPLAIAKEFEFERRQLDWHGLRMEFMVEILHHHPGLSNSLKQVHEYDPRGYPEASTQPSSETGSSGQS